MDFSINWQSFRIPPEYRSIQLVLAYKYICHKNNLIAHEAGVEYLRRVMEMQPIISRQVAASAIASAIYMED